MQKIAIIGSGGAGKSTLARQLGKILSLPVYHLDTLYWNPNWIPTPQEEWEALQKKLVQQHTWIADGNYGSTMHLRLQAADTLIFLDYPMLLCLWCILKRQWKYRGKTRPDMREGCKERLTWEFVNWVLQYRKTRRPGILKQLATLQTKKTVLIFTSRAQTNHFLQQLKGLSN